jgi:hypothetical protein
MFSGCSVGGRPVQAPGYGLGRRRESLERQGLIDLVLPGQNDFCRKEADLTKDSRTLLFLSVSLLSHKDQS